MKKIKILFTVLMLFAFVYKAEAQIVVTSTTASTKRPPTVTTYLVSNIREVSASCEGEVLDDGGSDIKARGICWSTHSNPTIEDNIASEIGGLGKFESNITGLTGNTRYYVCAYATNSTGTAYGEEKVFITNKPKSKSIRQKGLVVRPEIGIGLNLEKGMQLNILGIANYQFNPYISLGGGTGLSYNNFDEDFGQHFFSIPIYANIRGYFCDRKWSPYYDIKLGFNGTINQKDYYINNYAINQKYTDINLTGFYADFGLGMQYKNYDFGIELYLYPVNYDRFYYYPDGNFGFSEWRFAESVKEFDLFSVCLKFAYNFQIQKK